MGPWSRVRVAKCQMLVTCFFVLLLGLSVATMVTLTYFGAHFAVIRQASLEKNPYQAVHRWALSVGSSLVGLLTLGAVLSAAATMREAQGLMAGGFLCFALAFCAQVQVAFWRLHSPTQVEDAMLDTYDLVYEQAVKGTSHIRWQELVAIQDTFLCCGKRSPFSRLGNTEAELCRGEEAAREDCLQGIWSFLRTHQQVTFSLTTIGLALTLGSQGQIHPGPTSMWPPAPGAQPPQTLPGWTCTLSPLRSRYYWSKKMLGPSSVAPGQECCTSAPVPTPACPQNSPGQRSRWAQRAPCAGSFRLTSGLGGLHCHLEAPGKRLPPGPFRLLTSQLLMAVGLRFPHPVPAPVAPPPSNQRWHTE
nr:tetraspanin-32 isoform X1 [Saimiri boliviensis boliviensis]